MRKSYWNSFAIYFQFSPPSQDGVMISVKPSSIHVKSMIPRPPTLFSQMKNTLLSSLFICFKWLISHSSRFKLFHARHYEMYSELICQVTSTKVICLVSKLYKLRHRNRLTKSRKFNLSITSWWGTRGFLNTSLPP